MYNSELVQTRDVRGRRTEDARAVTKQHLVVVGVVPQRDVGTTLLEVAGVEGDEEGSIRRLAHDVAIGWARP